MRSLLPLLMIGALAPMLRGEVAADAAGVAFFEKHIRPVLASKCYQCHAADSEKLKGNLLLDTRDGIQRGGDSGPAVVPGNLKESLLIAAIRYTDKDTRMPPSKSGGKLPDEVIANFEAWVKMGAPDPREGAAPIIAKSIDLEKAREFWAFKAPQLPNVPEVKTPTWPRTDIDRFILAQLDAKGLRPVADADPRALIRRIYFDLLGLPPAPEQVEAFAAGYSLQNSASRIQNVTDQLLASPQFGERWARHWLDVARFAESAGRERNMLFPEAWRYRDYVIAAFNSDKPYDEFIREQIAGDLLPAKDDAERDEHLIATGFLALGPKGLNEKNREQFRMDLIDEQIDATSRAVLGLTVACARCHDHKYDPIPQRDYYALAGIFRSTETRFGTAGTYGNQRINKHGTPLLPLAAAASPETPPQPKSAPVREDGAKQRFEEFLARRPAQAKRFATLPPARKAMAAARFAEKNRANRNAAGAKAVAPAAAATAPQAMGVEEGRPMSARLLARGEIDEPGEVVPRGFVTVLAPAENPALPTAQSGRRELAEWLVTPANPLTARVMVNRVWGQLFGQGLVATADNFGFGGEKPSHPELLDFLAVKFSTPTETGGFGWSIKRLVAALVSTRAYQLSSAIDSAAREIDPDNHLLWRAAPRRLDAEAIRDGILAASGTLDRTPLHGSFVTTVGDGLIGRGLRPEMFTKYESQKRSIYLPIVRDLVPDALEVFDFAEPSLIVAARDVTNVPAQALYLMNNEFVRGQAAALAKRILATPLDHLGRIRLAYHLTLSRAPSTEETQRAQQYLIGEARGMIAAKGDSIAEAGQSSWATFCQALFACAEFRYLR